MNIDKNYTIKKVEIKHFSWYLSILTIFDYLWSSSGVKINIVFYFIFYFGHLPQTLCAICFVLDLYRSDY